MRPAMRITSLSLLGVLTPIACIAQSALERRIAAREGVCGNGKTYFRTEDDGWYGTFYSNDGMRNDPCVNGPVRVVITRAGKEVVRVETYVGPVPVDAPPAQELGAVPAKDAVGYLPSLAATGDGKPARDALTPAMLADSSVVTP